MMHLKIAALVLLLLLFACLILIFLVGFVCLNFCSSASRNAEFLDSPMALLLMRTNNAACPILCKVKLYMILIINSRVKRFI